MIEEIGALVQTSLVEHREKLIALQRRIQSVALQFPFRRILSRQMAMVLRISALFVIIYR